MKNNVVSEQYDRFKKKIEFQNKNSHTLRAYEPLLHFLKKHNYLNIRSGGK